jgi:PAS domain S-box-containing protein
MDRPDLAVKSGTHRPLGPLRGHLWALVVLLGALATVLTLWRVAYDREIRAASLSFVSNTEEIAEQLKQRMVQYELVAGGGASLFASVARPTPRQWYGYVEGMGIRSRFPAMVGLGFAGYVRQSRLGDLQLEWREAGWGLLEVRPQGMRRHYGPILYLEPRTPENIEAVGFDMFSEPTRREAMQRALDSGRPSLSGPVHLIQDGVIEATGLLLYLPVYRNGDRPRSEAARQEAMLGWVYVPFRVEGFVTTTLGNAHEQARFRIYDVSNDGEQLLFTTVNSDIEGPPAFRHDVSLDHYGRHWRIEFESPPLAAAAPRLKGLQNTLALGLFAALLMYAIAWMLARTESRAHSIALQLTEDFRRSELRFRTAMEHSAIGKALLDSQGRIVEANPALGIIVGRSPESLVGARFDSLFEDDEITAGGYHPGAATDDEGVHRSTRRLHREGGVPRHAQLTYAPLPGNIGQDIVGLVQAEDVTERLRAEAQVLALNRTLEARVTARTRELSLANQELEAFAYSVSHDLRAPLRAIDGFSRVLVERYSQELDQTGQDYLGRVRKAAGRMAELIDALLKMSRLSRSALKRDRVDISRIAAEILEELRAGDHEHDVQSSITPGLQVEGDAALLRNLLDNLLGNAWKFTRGREGARIDFGVQPTADGDEYFVRDNGAGFAQEYVDKLFRPFQRLHDQNVFAGHGIGLASVKRIVERHGGTIRAEGREGEGATFYFTLPDDASAL